MLLTLLRLRVREGFLEEIRRVLFERFVAINDCRLCSTGEDVLMQESDLSAVSSENRRVGIFSK